MTSIENGPAQVPNSQPNNEPRNNTTGVHPERVDSTLGGNTPAHPDYEPTTPSRGEVESRKGRTKYIVGGAAVMSVLVAAGAYFGAKAGTESSSNSIEDTGNTPGVAAPEVPGGESYTSGIDLGNNTATLETSIPKTEVTPAEMESMEAVDFAALDTIPKIDFYAPRIDEWKDASWSIMQKYLSDDEKKVLNNNFPADKAYYTDQDILNRHAIDVFDATSQTTDGTVTQKDMEEGKKMLSVLIDTTNDNYFDLVQQYENGDTGLKSVYEVVESYPRISNVTFRGVNVGENGAAIIKERNVNTGTYGYNLYRLLSTPAGNDVWEYTTQIAINDPNINSDIARAVSNSQ